MAVTGVTAESYSSLLQALRPQQDSTPAKKKRKLGNSKEFKITTKKSTFDTAESPSATHKPLHLNGETQRNDDVNEAPARFQDEPLRDDGQQEDGDDRNSDDDEDIPFQDPFEKHYFTNLDLQEGVSGDSSKATKPSATSVLGQDIRKTWFPRLEGDKAPQPLKGQQDLHLKKRLLSSTTGLTAGLSSLERDIAGGVFNYADVVAACRTLSNAPALRDICAIHSLNHVFKTRDRVLKNNSKLAQAENPEALDLRDQGFARPKVLVILPTKQACVRFVESIVKFSEPEQQENKSRFLDTFSRVDEDEWLDKPEDFRELFGGNHEEDFRIGLKFTRKTIKYFSGFYNSDIILASPLGLMRTITTGGRDKEQKKVEDADFLSSIEVAIMDHTSALQMQNWQHVDYIFSQMNLLPKESHGCDFSRARAFYLDGNAKYLRQTIILSAYLTPEINSLVSSQLHNTAGRVKYVPSYKGAMLDVANLLALQITQTFLRFDSPSPLNDGDSRFKHFTTTILPQLTRDANSQQGVLLFVPNYSDFTRLRNHIDNSQESTSLSFGHISEYTPVKEVARARSHFMSRRYSLLLYSERAHHHFRYRLRGVRKVIFYGIPENPVFWAEIVGLLGLDPASIQSDGTKGKGLVRALFSRWDVMRLERVVGTERAGRLVSERIGDTFDFV